MNILILGSNGQVGWELQRSLAPLGTIDVLNRNSVNLENLDDLRAAIRNHSPDVIVNAAAYTAVDKAESEPDLAKRINSDAVALLAEESKRIGAWLMHYSTDYVFDGKKTSPYVETDMPEPINVYGSSKLLGEEAIRDIGCRHLIFRTSWVYSSRGHNFTKSILRLANNRDELSIVMDQVGAPTHAELIADVTAHALHQCLFSRCEDRDGFAGIYHLVAAGETNWFDFAQFIIFLAESRGMKFRLRSSNIKPIHSEEYSAPAARPKNSRLGAYKLEQTFGLQMPDWRNQVRRTVLELLEQGQLQ